MKRVALCIALLLTTTGLTGAGTSIPGDPVATTPAPCTITVKARLTPGAVGEHDVSLALHFGTLSQGSKVRIKSGTWSQLGDSGEAAHVRFSKDGTWKEFYSYREGSGEWSGQFTLNMGCRYNRRYEFNMNRLDGGSVVANVRPQYPSTSSWTTTQTINLGDLAKYF